MQQQEDTRHIGQVLQITGSVGLLGPPSRGPDIDYNNADRMTPLQKHCAFFDLNRDGVLHPRETYEGFRLLGYSVTLSVIGAVIIHAAFSYLTQDSFIPDPTFPVYLKNIHRCVHGSDTGTYNNDGTLKLEKLMLVLNRFDAEKKGGLTLWQGLQMTEQQRDAFDPMGWISSKLEWGFLWILAADARGVVSKEALVGHYDGSLFYEIARQRQQQQQQQRHQ